ncbi:heparanase-like [Euwallacea similis]|uniref:heparanase-like n=1 Tax=Euwallacea similis TaxID=1736056 RepID=UPI00344C4A88
MNISYSLLLLTLLPIAAQSLKFILNSRDKLFEVNENFLSVALDSSSIQHHFTGFNLTDPFLTNLVRHLAPLYFRVGGTYADRIVFSEKDEEGTIGASDVTFLASDYVKLYQFTQNVGARLIYDLNSLLRSENGTWDSENAEEMIKFSNEHNMELDWELGNEPDLYSGIYNTSVNASELAKDYKALRNILNNYTLYESSYLLGIDLASIGSNQDYLQTFLQEAGDVVYGTTWHQYYFAAKDATEDLFLNPNTFNILAEKAHVMKDVVERAGQGNKIWLGETSTAYNGGAANMSNRFIGTFLWIDKLGLGASLGMEVIIRQTIFYSNYALIDNNYVPNPDWWVSVLYKTLVGTTVLTLENDGTTNNTVRLYAHCGLGASSRVTVFGINVANEEAVVEISGFQAGSKVQSYELVSESTLYSQFIKLNGEILKVKSNGDLPDLKAKSIENSGNFTLPAYSITFLVFDDTDVTACL